MDLGELLMRAARLTWRHKTLWWLGLLPGLTHLATSLARLWVMDYARREIWPLLRGVSTEPPPSLEQWLLSPEFSQAFFNGRFLLLLVGWLFLAAVVFWLLVTLAEAAVIAATVSITDGRSPTVAQALSTGRRWLSRFIAIDAVVFLPWFIIALGALVVMGVTVGVTAVRATQETTVSAMLTSLGLGLSCTALLACLLIPVGFLATRFRTLAFRDAALSDSQEVAGGVLHGNVQQNINHTWQIIRQNLAEVIILVGMVWGLQYIFNLLLSLISLPLGLATAVPTLLSFSQPGSGNTAVANLVGLGTAVLLAVPQALLFVYFGVLWTLAYLEWNEA
ncbi:MAG: hypothetical protein H6661_00345 [Ardenticatenaceae bacterium]|nr:hypothetical protein [Ardenticatenaceae bacterium]